MFESLHKLLSGSLVLPFGQTCFVPRHAVSIVMEPQGAVSSFRQFSTTGTITTDSRDFMNPATEESAIIDAVMHGDVEDFRILVERYQKPIFNLMLRITGSTMTAEDLTQDIFERAYAKLYTFKTGRRFFPWLYTIAVNAGRDHLRKKGLRHDLFKSEPESESLANPEKKDDCVNHLDCIMDAGKVSDAVDRIPLKYSEPLLLYYREGFSVKEIAAALTISVPSVKVRIHRGRELIKRVIGVNHVP